MRYLLFFLTLFLATDSFCQCDDSSRYLHDSRTYGIWYNRARFDTLHIPRWGDTLTCQTQDQPLIYALSDSLYWFDGARNHNLSAGGGGGPTTPLAGNGLGINGDSVIIPSGGNMWDVINHASGWDMPTYNGIAGFGFWINFNNLDDCQPFLGITSAEVEGGNTNLGPQLGINTEAGGTCSLSLAHSFFTANSDSNSYYACLRSFDDPSSTVYDGTLRWNGQELVMNEVGFNASGVPMWDLLAAQGGANAASLTSQAFYNRDSTAFLQGLPNGSGVLRSYPIANAVLKATTLPLNIVLATDGSSQAPILGEVNVMNPSSPLTALDIVLPAGTRDGQSLTITFTHIIAAITWSGATTLRQVSSTTADGAQITLYWSSANSVWL